MKKQVLNTGLDVSDKISLILGALEKGAAQCSVQSSWMTWNLLGSGKSWKPHITTTTSRYGGIACVSQRPSSNVFAILTGVRSHN